ncbi:MAG: hypothetical protein AAF688_07130 [Bacteroidota bacterium]
MVTVLTTIKYKDEINQLISGVPRLGELVNVIEEENKLEVLSKVIFVDNNLIKAELDWFDTEPPYIIPEVVFNENNFLALVFYKLGNQQKAFEFISENNALYYPLLIATHIQFQYEISEKMFSNENTVHNQCIISHYGNYVNGYDSTLLKNLYQEAIKTAIDDEFKAFTIKHYCNFLADLNDFQEVERIVRLFDGKGLTEKAKIELELQLASALTAQLEFPYGKEILDEISKLFKKGIEFYESNELKVKAGLLYIDASAIENYKGDLIKSKELINQAILIFKQEDIPEFLGEAGLQKATLLYKWSKNGSPQYYKPAINAFQDTLKVFKRDTHPKKFADVHHNLALIYSEIPVSLEEKPIWTAFCASSFKEVLKFYNKENYPYEYAMASHNYATALMSFPEAKLHNNSDKAFWLFEEALSIRSEEKYPFERALTLINQLELFWIMHNENSDEESRKYSLMLNKANEISRLVTDGHILEKAKEHLLNLESLNIILN